jgi:hypothetical protein
MTGWQGRNGHFEARGSELPPCWESKGLAIPISSVPVSLQVEARFDGCPRAVEDRGTGTGSRVAIGESSAVIGADGAATSDHRRPFMPSASTVLYLLISHYANILSHACLFSCLFSERRSTHNHNQTYSTTRSASSIEGCCGPSFMA